MERKQEKETTLRITKNISPWVYLFMSKVNSSTDDINVECVSSSAPTCSQYFPVFKFDWLSVKISINFSVVAPRTNTFPSASVP